MSEPARYLLVLDVTTEPEDIKEVAQTLAEGVSPEVLRRVYLVSGNTGEAVLAVLNINAPDPSTD
jgi:hypothetical protein